jgi:hypothetical protein
MQCEQNAYAKCDRSTLGGTFDVDEARESVSIRGREGAFWPEMDLVVVDELCGQCDEGDVASETPVVEAVDANGRDTIDLARGVHGDDSEVATAFEGCSDLAVEWGEAAS